ncbi:MAG TPA: DUF4234 domain-containing protein [Acidobacteriota bacterium]|nr:DUF4234 domain-containing protein [Acidobacteriota bacterium]
MEPQVKYRNMWGQVGLMIITLGIYSIYWFYQTAVELKGLAKAHSAEPALWTILLFIPFANLYSYYKYSDLYEFVSSDHFNRWIMWLLWICFSPAVWLIVQLELNRRATYDRP